MKTSKFKLLVFLSILGFTSFAQNLDEIIAKHIEAIGGKQNWEKLKSLRTESLMKAQGADIKFVSVNLDKKARRQDIFVMGMNGYSIVNNTEGWSFYPWQGQTKPEAMTTDDVKNTQTDLYIQDEFLTYKDLGKSIDYFGLDDIDGTECHKIKMTDKDGKETTFYIDPATYYIIKRTSKTEANGQVNEHSTFFSDYKKTDIGLVIPMSTSGGWGETEITKIEINPVIDESIFKVSK